MKEREPRQSLRRFKSCLLQSIHLRSDNIRCDFKFRSPVFGQNIICSKLVKHIPPLKSYQQNLRLRHDV
jgi:hypothetical protein